jgi:molecular chaperone IbpA
VQNASFDNGLLRIALKREIPEAMKPRRIEIAAAPAANDRIEAPAADKNAA